jgi:Fic family protein
MWLGKLNREGQKKILRFLAENPNGKFTRHQLALSTGQKYSTIKAYVNQLKRNLLIKEEGDFIKINPDL